MTNPELNLSSPAAHAVPPGRSAADQVASTAANPAAKPATNPLAKPATKRGAIGRRLLVAFALFAVLGIVGYWQRFTLLVLATSPLVVDDRPAGVSAVLPTDAGVAFRVAAAWVTGTRAETLLLHSPKPDRLTRMGLRPGLRDQFTTAMAAYKVPRYVCEDFTEFPIETPREFHAELAKWLDSHPEQTVAIVAPRFRTRVTSLIAAQLLSPDHRKRVFIVPADSAQFDPGRWWDNKDGIRTVADGWLRLAAYVLRGCTPPVPRERTDAEFIAAAVGEIGPRPHADDATAPDGASQ
jgi:hypothetical protein